MVNQRPILIAHGPLRDFCEGLLVAAGLTPADARLVADSLVEANLSRAALSTGGRKMQILINNS